MGNPVTEPVDRSRRDMGSTHCPVLRHGAHVDRNPFRRTLPFLPYLEEPERGSVWTRNIRQRGEVLHTEAPELSEELRNGEIHAHLKCTQALGISTNKLKNQKYLSQKWSTWTRLLCLAKHLFSSLPQAMHSMRETKALAYLYCACTGKGRCVAHTCPESRRINCTSGLFPDAHHFMSSLNLQRIQE